MGREIVEVWIIRGELKYKGLTKNKHTGIDFTFAKLSIVVLLPGNWFNDPFA